MLPNCKNCKQLKKKTCQFYQISIEDPEHTTCLYFSPRASPGRTIKHFLLATALGILFLILGVIFL